METKRKTWHPFRKARQIAAEKRRKRPDLARTPEAATARQERKNLGIQLGAR